MHSIQFSRSELLRNKGQFKLSLLHIEIKNDKKNQLDEILAETLIETKGENDNENA